MFDYQAGEKYKLTLIMVGVAGLIAGMFFTMLLMPTEAPASHHKGAGAMSARVLNDPDITGGRGGPGLYAQNQAATVMQASGAVQASMPAAQPVALVDRAAAQMFMQNWLPRVWDLSAQTAGGNQEEAIKWMTPDCAAAYRQNIWTSDTAAQVSQSSLQSEFHVRSMDVGENLGDGSVVVKVQGTQILKAPAGQKTKEVNLEYMLKQTPEGLRIAGISEVNNAAPTASNGRPMM